jgi:hypothetical protein
MNLDLVRRVLAVVRRIWTRRPWHLFIEERGRFGRHTRTAGRTKVLHKHKDLGMGTENKQNHHANRPSPGAYSVISSRFAYSIWTK